MLDPRYEQSVSIYEVKGGEEETSTCNGTVMKEHTIFGESQKVGLTILKNRLIFF